MSAHDGSYLGPEHSAVTRAIDPNDSLPFGTPGNNVPGAERRSQLDPLNELNGLAEVGYPDDQTMRARITFYELTFRMQMSVPEVVRLSDESQTTQELYGLNDPATQSVGRVSLTTWRLFERGVRFVQIYDDGASSHRSLYVPLLTGLTAPGSPRSHDVVGNHLIINPSVPRSPPRPRGSRLGCRPLR